MSSAPAVDHDRANGRGGRHAAMRGVAMFTLATILMLTGCAVRRESIALDHAVRVQALRPEQEPRWPLRADASPLAWRGVMEAAPGDSTSPLADSRFIVQSRAVGPALVDFMSMVRSDRVGTVDELKSLYFTSYVFTPAGREAASKALAGSDTQLLSPGYKIKDFARANLTMLVRKPVDGIKNARGSVIFLHGMGGRSYATRIADEFFKRGWMVLESQGGSFRTYDDAETRSPDDKLQKVEFGMTPDRLRELGESVAKSSEFPGDVGYTVNGVWTVMLEAYPELADKPVVLVGCSFGAICSPTVAAMLPRKPDAMVLVGGGADVLGIIAESTFMELNVPEEWGERRFTADEVRQLSAMYRPLALSDPYQTAPRVADVPTLMLHARGDRIVPAKYGDLLWERLGRPERWSWWYGHELMFYFLPDYASDIVDWTQATVADR